MKFALKDKSNKTGVVSSSQPQLLSKSKTGAASSPLKSTTEVPLRQSVSSPYLPEPLNMGKGKGVIDEAAEKASKKRKTIVGKPSLLKDAQKASKTSNLEESPSTNDWKVVEETSSAAILHMVAKYLAMASVLILKDVNKNASLLDVIAKSKKKIEDLQKLEDYKEVPYQGTEEFTHFVDGSKADGIGALMYTLWFHHRKFDFSIFGEEIVKLASTFIDSDDEKVTEQVGKEATQDLAGSRTEQDQISQNIVAVQ
ncbi:hypothetical protein TorRG33x02_280020 [Trema orientale]|uniref:Uncharacterized protein n=1 Tax=Trema orientale TaxID=63057 RepID=A0A2P5CMF6_TREOI|nr:hypothetical protein TorRG33x02_280020 [Trema orientale]